MRKFKYSMAVGLLVLLAGCGEKTAEKLPPNTLPPGVCPASKTKAIGCMNNARAIRASYEFKANTPGPALRPYLCPGVSDDLFFCTQAFIETDNWPATIPPRQPLPKGECPPKDKAYVCNIRANNIQRGHPKYAVRTPGDIGDQQNARQAAWRHRHREMRCPATPHELYLCNAKIRRTGRL